MKAAAFNELVASVRQAGRIRRGEARASRRFTYRAEDVAAIRDRLHQSQSEFARMIGVSVSTLQNWEQGRRVPQGPALALLKVAAANPRAVAKALSAAPKRGAA
jgi:putative transcriptional regulator